MNTAMITCTRIRRTWFPDISSKYPTEPTPALTSCPSVPKVSTSQPASNAEPNNRIRGFEKTIMTNARGTVNPKIHFVNVWNIRPSRTCSPRACKSAMVGEKI